MTTNTTQEATAELRADLPRRGSYVAVCGESDPDTPHRGRAREVGRLLAETGSIVICGGLGGVMEAVSEGASAVGGMVVGLLPGPDRAEANPHLTVVLPTGMGQGRNLLMVTAAQAVIAIGRGWGTLSEISLGLRLGRPVVGLMSWEIDGLAQAATPAEAVHLALGQVDRS